MKYRNLILLSALLSLNSFAGVVSFEEKQNRVEYLEELQKNVPMMDIDVYRRELQYEKLNLTVEERAKNEAALLAEQIKTQVARAYEVLLVEKTSDEAAAEVRAAIEKDSQLLAPELREDIKTLALNTLADLQRGHINSEETLHGADAILLDNVRERYEFLNEEGEDMPVSAMVVDPTLPKVNKDRDAERKEYSSKAEIVQSLASDRENVRWISTGGVTLKSAVSTKRDANISLQVKAEFLGVSLSAGPSFSFSREYSTDVQVMAEGMNPVLGADGNFDFFKRDANGNIIKKGGKAEKRFINFYCDAGLDFGTEAKTGGGFSIEGIGGGVGITASFKNSVSLTSRRVVVPEFIDGKTATFKLLAQICMNDFVKARITSNMTVKDSLNIMMKNVVSSLRYSHPKTKCAQDSHCYKWFNKEIVSLNRAGNLPRCVETADKFMTCELRGQKGQNCTVIEGGKRTSDGQFEFKCDAGLRCVKYQNAGWFRNWEIYQYAKGRCMPIR